MSTQPFTPTGKTVAITANITAPAATRVVAAGNVNSVTYRVANPEANETVWYTMDSDANCAANCVIPTGGGSSSKFALPLPSGGVEIVRGPQGAYFTGVTRTLAANLFVTPGDGM